MSLVASRDRNESESVLASSDVSPKDNDLGSKDSFCECEWRENVAGHGYVSANAGRRCYVGPTSPQTFSANFFRQLFCWRFCATNPIWSTRRIPHGRMRFFQTAFDISHPPFDVVLKVGFDTAENELRQVCCTMRARESWFGFVSGLGREGRPVPDLSCTHPRDLERNLWPGLGGWSLYASANVERLVLGCINAKFCKQISNTCLKALDEIYKMYTYVFKEKSL